ncbi:anaphase-promoting complex subunit 11 RING-H2 finger-domain containing protein [Nitzschia inconspicua]|uniref:Anaphase-promoting complex subunit 11 RING-H2 finger-domain containing protein n=1 Tax=Nitzschia inconspicua TaxID=303405 RepID=A0A9K3KUY6_9STRA|nr:anaphase-promoting complex subunit 11 RING-H2 finger-domain containing protein [Nitzschia inconspicua]
MSSRKRSSETPLVSAGKADMEVVEEGQQDGSSFNVAVKSRPRLRVRIRRYHGVAKWTWNVGRGDEEEEEVCGICQSAFEGTPPGVKYPGDEAPVVFGVCGHAFHLQCVATWLNSSRQTCPICRADWEYGNSEQSNNRSGGGGGGNQLTGSSTNDSTSTN